MANQAYVVGETVEGDVTVERFQQTASSLHYDVMVVRDYSKAQQRLAQRATAKSAGERDLVLFCVSPGLKLIRERLEALCAPNRRTIVYADEKRASTRVAVEYCHHGLADDFLVWSEDARVDERVKSLHDGRCLYAAIPVKPSNASVFIATPYQRHVRQVLSEAVDPALERLALEPRWADAAYRDCTVPAQVRTEIRASGLMIANIAQDPECGDNANVYYEVGYACALEIPVIYVRPWAERELPVPVDIADRQRIEYDSPIDLALRLYHGLRP